MASRAARIVGRLEQLLDTDLLTAAHPEKNLLLLVSAGIADAHLEHEPVELCLRQRVGALALDWVLGGQYQERLIQRVGSAADGDLVFLHGLQQRGLHLGRCAVDLVRQDDLGEQRPLLDVKLLALLVEDHRSDHVGGEEIGRELNPGERGVDDLRQRPDGEGLGQSGNAFEQDVATGEQPHQQPLDHGVLPHDAPGHFLENPRDRQQLRRLRGQLRGAHSSVAPRGSVSGIAGYDLACAVFRTPGRGYRFQCPPGPGEPP